MKLFLLMYTLQCLQNNVILFCNSVNLFVLVYAYASMSMLVYASVSICWCMHVLYDLNVQLLVYYLILSSMVTHFWYYIVYHTICCVYSVSSSRHAQQVNTCKYVHMLSAAICCLLAVVSFVCVTIHYSTAWHEQQHNDLLGQC